MQMLYKYHLLVQNLLSDNYIEVHSFLQVI